MASFKLQFLTALILFLRTVVSQTTAIDYCSALDDVLQICTLETPGFTDLPATQQASCVCGNEIGTIPWGPSTFDLVAARCASQYASIDVTIASDAAQLANFCTKFGAGVTTGITDNIVSSTTSRTLRTTTTSLGASNTGGLFTSAVTSNGGSGATTVISVVTAPSAGTTPKSSNAAAKAQGRFDLLGIALPVGGLLLGGL